MKLNITIKKLALLAFLFLAARICEGQRLPAPKAFAKPTSYAKIEAMHSKFTEHPRRIAADNRNVVNSARISQMRTDTTMALLGWNGSKLSVDFLPANAPVDAVIRGRQAALLRKLRAEGFPLGLDGFPIAIKIEKAAFDTIYKYTQCQSFLVLPCIEDAWDGGANHPHARHFTLAILGSERTSNAINHLHTGKQLKQNELKKAKALDRALDGEETWPYESFTWASLE